MTLFRKFDPGWSWLNATSSNLPKTPLARNDTSEITKPTITEQAEIALNGIVSYIARDKIDAAFDWLNDITAKFYLLLESPDIGVGVRCTFFKRYIIFFRKTRLMA